MDTLTILILSQIGLFSILFGVYVGMQTNPYITWENNIVPSAYHLIRGNNRMWYIISYGNISKLRIIQIYASRDTITTDLNDVDEKYSIKDY